MAAVPDDALFPLLNVGSSTLEFRARTQPYIDDNIFAPLRARGGKVYHLDLKRAPGVDIVGDLSDLAVLDKIRNLRIRAVIMSNLLEHVSDRKQLCDAVLSILPPGGYIFATGPQSYPYHPDPIDTMFRPTIAEIHAHLVPSTIVESAIIDSGNWKQWNSAERGRPLWRTIARLFAPFYRPVKWWGLARQSPYIFRHITAFAVILRKEG